MWVAFEWVGGAFVGKREGEGVHFVIGIRSIVCKGLKPWDEVGNFEKEAGFLGSFVLVFVMGRV